MIWIWKQHTWNDIPISAIRIRVWLYRMCVVCAPGWLLTCRKIRINISVIFIYGVFFFEIMFCAWNISSGMNSNGGKLSHALGVIGKPYFNDKFPCNGKCSHIKSLDEFVEFFLFFKEDVLTINDKNIIHIDRIDIKIGPFFMYLIGNIGHQRKDTWTINYIRLLRNVLLKAKEYRCCVENG